MESRKPEAAIIGDLCFEYPWTNDLGRRPHKQLLVELAFFENHSEQFLDVIDSFIEELFNFASLICVSNGGISLKNSTGFHHVVFMFTCRYSSLRVERYFMNLEDK